ncbi:major histocompatibility complex class I-related gene protein isoform X1 [Sarcophilus harrisii]|uniref:MHC class I antigen n=1 Tax=Sarcophilus harrisii TaxID=9305 RepID=K9HXI3_SARHA|nr:major histocompatibility complex class I-related gene protein precursor [Sarcophilus harrisii]XP_031820041.1 major histocompatibility complex class I-related gene protein isoform X1 [Sarcophilus harrisii]AIS75090.1 MHC class I antigen [Sarcophilus harrisii]FAA00768.1 TPA: MHC class I-related protein [Sarcophilus harrisii]
MIFLLHLLMTVAIQEGHARTHSLRYFRLGVSDSTQGIPEFISVGYVDSHPITSYDSIRRQKMPQASWMEENLGSDHWEKYTQLLRGWQQTFKTELRVLQNHYNHTGGFHTYQRMIGCELLEDGSTTGFLQYAYDGKDFLIFDKDSLSWIAVDNVARLTKQVWETNLNELRYQKNWLETECIAWLKKFLDFGKDSFQRTENPLLRGSCKKSSLGITTLICRAYGFYPPEITMTWIKNGELIIQEIEYGDILPSGDGTYQTWISIEIDPQSKDHYFCQVEHNDFLKVLHVPIEPKTISPFVEIISGFTVIVLFLIGLGIFVYRRKQSGIKEANYIPTPVK